MTPEPAEYRRLPAGLSKDQLLVALGLAAVAILVTLDAWRDIVYLALRDEESSHILLVPLVVIWLAWVRRSRLALCTLRGMWLGPALAAAGAALYIAGDQYMIDLFWHGGAVLMLVGSVIAVCGSDLLLRFLPVFVVLAFLLPVPGRVRQQIAIPLQEATAWATEQVCDLAGWPMERSGNLLSINGVEVAVAEACNGMRMTFALVLVSYVFAFSTPLKGYIRIILILLSPVSAIVCNVIRLVPTVWVFGNFSAETAELFHDIAGWVMLLVAFAMLTSVIRLLHWLAVPVAPYMLARD